MMIEPTNDTMDEAELAKQEALAAKLDAFGNSLVKYREEAIAGRKSSGIEDEWNECEDAYQGIDDANRGSVAQGKPSSPNGGYVNGSPQQAAGRSTVFLNITRPYVDASAARVGDMMLPTDDTPWSLKPTKLPNTLGQVLPGGLPNQSIALPPDMTAAPAMPGMPAAPGTPPGAPQGMPPAPMDPVAAAAKEVAEKATVQIEDWLTECQWHAEVRKMIEDCARLGTGILKGPVPVKRISRVAEQVEGQMALVIKEEIKPASKAVSPWKCFPDPACGENIQDGNYFWEVDSLTHKALRDLKGLPGYISFQIEKVMQEGPSGKNRTDGLRYDKVKQSDDDNYEVWYFYGQAKREDLQAAGVEVPEDGDVSVPAIVTMVNNTVIKAALNPLDSGEFPYDMMPWQRKTGMPWGTGIGKQINTPQRMLNAATRNMLDNAGLSAGPQIVLRRGVIVPADGSWRLTPRKIWYAVEGAEIQDIRAAFTTVNIPTMQVELNNIIQFALKMAEDVTGMPMLMQGQAGANAPDTVGGMQMLNNNASVVLRRIARMFDDKVTEPHIRRYYEWLLMYGEDDALKQGDLQIDARGSTALVERDIQNQAILQMGALVMNPSFGIDPAKWIQEALKAQRLDPKRFLMDPEKQAQIQSQPQPAAPQVEAAKIRAETEMQKLQAQAATDMQLAQLEASTELQKTQIQVGAQVQKMQVDTDRDTVYVQAQAARDQANVNAKMQELELKRQIAMLDYANKRELSLEQVKADLAQTAMKLRATKELAELQATADRLPKPPVEPPGRAPKGQSFTK